MRPRPLIMTSMLIHIDVDIDIVVAVIGIDDDIGDYIDFDTNFDIATINSIENNAICAVCGAGD